MHNVQDIRLHGETREEMLPGFVSDFPYIATCAHLDQYPEPFVPWHWHKAVELFYMEKGTLEYETPNGKTLFTEGSGGLVNYNVLHMTRIIDYPQITTQKLHIFDPAFIAGQSGGRIEQNYFLPITANPLFEVLQLSPDVPDQALILKLIREAFSLNEQEVGYEILLQRILLEIWLKLYCVYRQNETTQFGKTPNVEAAKRMMLYIHEHLAESITVDELSTIAFISERECYRVFRECLHTTPVHYIISCRLQEACRMLIEGRATVTETAYACGFGSGAYFCRVFTCKIGCNPIEYQKNWQDRIKKRP